MTDYLFMQNLLKSIFIAIFPVFVLYVAFKSGLHLLQNEFSYQHLGVLISAIAIVVFFSGLFIIPQARTSKNLNSYTIFVVVGLIFSLFFGLFVEASSTFNIIFSVTLGIGWIAYLKWYSVFNKRDTSILRLGEFLPNFDLEDTNKNKVPSTSFLGNPSIYLFYRGNWCPLCMAQIKEIATQYKEMEQRGVNMILVSPQPHGYSKSLAKKFNLGFHFLTDANNTVAKQLGIFAENGIPAGFQALGYDSNTVLPTVIITDDKGQIVFADLTDNYRVRPEPETFLKVIDELS